MFYSLCLTRRVLPPLQTLQQVRPGDETCFPLCYLHNVQHVCQALTFNNASSFAASAALELHRSTTFCFKPVCVWFQDFHLGFVITVMQTGNGSETRFNVIEDKCGISFDPKQPPSLHGGIPAPSPHPDGRSWSQIAGRAP